MSQKNIIDIVNSYVNVLKKAGIPIEKVFLYGSYARNEANDESDIDLLLISKIFDTNNDYILSKPWLYTTEIDHRIEPLAVGTKRFETDDVSPILEIVRREGIEIKV